MMAEIEEQRQQARREALEEHTRLMGLAGTPEFRPEANMEVFNNIERVVTDWRLLKAEKEAFRTQRDAALAARTQEVLAENARLKEQVTRLSASVRQLQRIRDIWQETVEAVTGSTVAARVLDQVKALPAAIFSMTSRKARSWTAVRAGRDRSGQTTARRYRHGREPIPHCFSRPTLLPPSHIHSEVM